MSAQMKANERAALDVKLKNRRTDLFWIDRGDGREELLDQIQQDVSNFLDQILNNYGADHGCDTGQIIENSIANVAMRIERALLAKQMHDDLLPSWKSRVET